MSKTIYRLVAIREFETKADAIKAAERLERMGDRKVTVFHEVQTDSGQPYERHPIWKDLRQQAQERNQRLYERLS
jgi:hypothetical protein